MDYHIVSVLKIQNAWRIVHEKLEAYRIFRYYVVAREAAYYAKMRLNYIENSVIIIQAHIRKSLAFLIAQRKISQLLEKRDDHYIRFITCIANRIDLSLTMVQC